MNIGDGRQLFDTVFPVVSRARAAILDVYHSGRFETEEKSDKSPVTVADKASNTIITEGLARIFPKIPVVSEESRSGDQQQAADWFWLVDPLDGTKEFIRRNGEFTINVALVDGTGAPRWGLVDVPLYDQSFFAGGGEAFCRTAEGVRPLPALRPVHPHESLIVAVSRSHQGSADDWLREHRVPVRQLVYSGSAIKFCWLAEGRIDFYPRLLPTMGWDTAAGQALVEAVGGVVTGIENGQPLRYRPRAEINPTFVACRPPADEFTTSRF